MAIWPSSGVPRPDKGLDLAIRAAREVGKPLRVAAKLDRSQRPWFDAAIAPLLRGGGIELIGEVSAVERAELAQRERPRCCIRRGGASPLDLRRSRRWRVEHRSWHSAVARADEVIDDGTTGIVVDDEHDLADAVTGALGLRGPRVERTSRLASPISE